MNINWKMFIDYLPAFIVFTGTIVILSGMRYILNKVYKGREGYHFRKQIFTLVLIIISLFIFILALPLKNELKDQVLKILGLILSALIAFSSTTVLSNLIAGLMLRAMKNFRPGDFITVQDYSGRVTETGLYHVEIQTINRNLITIPNSFILKYPVDVTRSSGTYVEAELSLGYDIPRGRIEPLLIEAAEKSELTDPFVQVTELGDHAVTYRVYGFLKEVKNLIAARSQLKKVILDVLHGAGIEIVSPRFINRRVFDENQKFIPEQQEEKDNQEENEENQEKAFDKAEEAESLYHLKEKLETIEKEIDELKDKRFQTEIDSDKKKAVKEEIKNKQHRKKRLQELITKKEEEKEKSSE
jgi:small conductance mechanosensitive channel